VLLFLGVWYCIINQVGPDYSFMREIRLEIYSLSKVGPDYSFKKEIDEGCL
jgi:hypothetical protein